MNSINVETPWSAEQDSDIYFGLDFKVMECDICSARTVKHLLHLDFLYNYEI